MKPEQLLATQMANVMKEEYPLIIYRFDIGADVPLPIQLAMRSKELHGKWNKGYPDMFISMCKKIKKQFYGGLYLELKATDTVPNSEHTRRQAYIHLVLSKAGYKCMFCCGFEDCVKKLRKYLK